MLSALSVVRFFVRIVCIFTSAACIQVHLSLDFIIKA